jgi:hypothetical protein
MRSVPPRGSGWVRCIINLNSSPEPTRYRVVVLTSWDRPYRNSAGQTPPVPLLAVHLRFWHLRLLFTLYHSPTYDRS